MASEGFPNSEGDAADSDGRPNNEVDGADSFNFPNMEGEDDSVALPNNEVTFGSVATAIFESDGPAPNLKVGVRLFIAADTGLLNFSFGSSFTGDFPKS